MSGEDRRLDRAERFEVRSPELAQDGGPIETYQSGLPIIRRHNLVIDATRCCICDELIAQPASRSEKVVNHAPPPRDALLSPLAPLFGASDFIGSSLAA